MEPAGGGVRGQQIRAQRPVRWGATNVVARSDITPLGAASRAANIIGRRDGAAR